VGKAVVGATVGAEEMVRIEASERMTVGDGDGASVGAGVGDSEAWTVGAMDGPREGCAVVGCRVTGALERGASDGDAVGDSCVLLLSTEAALLLRLLSLLPPVTTRATVSTTAVMSSRIKAAIVLARLVSNVEAGRVVSHLFVPSVAKHAANMARTDLATSASTNNAESAALAAQHHVATGHIMGVLCLMSIREGAITWAAANYERKICEFARRHWCPGDKGDVTCQTGTRKNRKIFGRE
jgi:hypothetical protein